VALEDEAISSSSSGLPQGKINFKTSVKFSGVTQTVMS